MKALTLSNANNVTSLEPVSLQCLKKQQDRQKRQLKRTTKPVLSTSAIRGARKRPR